jgi:ribonucleotide monophosphatase NagD (HAD superfamily)
MVSSCVATTRFRALCPRYKQSKLQVVQHRAAAAEIKQRSQLLYAGCPYVFVTNSTGYTETRKANAIAATLGCNVDASKMIMAHSSMRSDLMPLQVTHCHVQACFLLLTQYSARAAASRRKVHRVCS